MTGWFFCMNYYLPPIRAMRMLWVLHWADSGAVSLYLLSSVSSLCSDLIQYSHATSSIQVEPGHIPTEKLSHWDQGAFLPSVSNCAMFRAETFCFLLCGLSQLCFCCSSSFCPQAFLLKSMWCWSVALRAATVYRIMNSAGASCTMLSAKMSAAPGCL